MDRKSGRVLQASLAEMGFGDPVEEPAAAQARRSFAGTQACQAVPANDTLAGFLESRMAEDAKGRKDQQLDKFAQAARPGSDPQGHYAPDSASFFSWQLMQNGVQGMASSRLRLISWWQTWQTPNSSRRSLFRASSI
jgi:hypothetical protein